MKTFKSSRLEKENKRGNQLRFPLLLFRCRKPLVAEIDGQVGAES